MTNHASYLTLQPLEREREELVYALYGMTLEAIQIVEYKA